VEIRPAVEADAERIADLWNEMIRDTLWTFTTAEKTTAQIVTLMEGVGDVFVAETDNQIVGFATYSQFRTGPGYANSMEHSIVVSEHHTGQKLGDRLLLAVEKDAREKGFRTMIGGISSANPRGEAFHARLGYTHMGTLKEVGFKNGQWLDLILMQKML